MTFNCPKRIAKAYATTFMAPLKKRSNFWVVPQASRSKKKADLLNTLSLRLCRTKRSANRQQSRRSSLFVVN